MNYFNKQIDKKIIYHLAKRLYEKKKRTKEFMVQLQTFTSSDYLLKNNCFDNN